MKNIFKVLVLLIVIQLSVVQNLSAQIEVISVKVRLNDGALTDIVVGDETFFTSLVSSPEDNIYIEIEFADEYAYYVEAPVIMNFLGDEQYSSLFYDGFTQTSTEAIWVYQGPILVGGNHPVGTYLFDYVKFYVGESLYTADVYDEQKFSIIINPTPNFLNITNTTFNPQTAIPSIGDTIFDYHDLSETFHYSTTISTYFDINSVTLYHSWSPNESPTVYASDPIEMVELNDSVWERDEVIVLLTSFPEQNLRRFSLDSIGINFQDHEGDNKDTVFIDNYYAFKFVDGLCTATTSSIFPESCGIYTAPDNQTYNASGEYTAVIPNSAGCDSTISIDLTVTNINTDVSQNAETLISNEYASGVSYQWLDCNNGNASISGATGQSYTATSNGNYAVRITNGSCVETSSCYSITTVGIDNLPNSGISLMPNPVNDVLQIKGNKQIQTVVILDNVGRTLKEYSVNNTDYKIDMSELKIGIYFIKIKTDNSVYLDKVIKQ